MLKLPSIMENVGNLALIEPKKRKKVSEAERIAADLSRLTAKHAQHSKVRFEQKKIIFEDSRIQSASAGACNWDVAGHRPSYCSSAEFRFEASLPDREYLTRFSVICPRCKPRAEQVFHLYCSYCDEILTGSIAGPGGKIADHVVTIRHVVKEAMTQHEYFHTRGGISRDELPKAREYVSKLEKWASSIRFKRFSEEKQEFDQVIAGLRLKVEVASELWQSVNSFESAFRQNYGMVGFTARQVPESFHDTIEKQPVGQRFLQVLQPPKLGCSSFRSAGLIREHTTPLQLLPPSPTLSKTSVMFDEDSQNFGTYQTTDRHCHGTWDSEMIKREHCILERERALRRREMQILLREEEARRRTCVGRDEYIPSPSQVGAPSQLTVVGSHAFSDSNVGSHAFSDSNVSLRGNGCSNLVEMPLDLENLTTELKCLSEAFAGWPVRIYHVGSTAVPNALCRPFVDLLLVFYPSACNSYAQASSHQTLQAAICARAQQIGYQHLHLPPGEIMLKPLGHGQIKGSLLLVTEANNPSVRRMIQFRDALIANPQLVEQFNQLKVAHAGGRISASEYQRQRETLMRCNDGSSDELTSRLGVCRSTPDAVKCWADAGYSEGVANSNSPVLLLRRTGAPTVANKMQLENLLTQQQLNFPHELPSSGS